MKFPRPSNWTRHKGIVQTSSYRDLFDYEKRVIDWVHRSAYDFVNDPIFVRNFLVSLSPIEETLQKVLAGSILNFALAPSASSGYPSHMTTSYWRLQDTIRDLAIGLSLSPSTVASATDCLYRVCLQCNADEFRDSELPEAAARDYAFGDSIIGCGMYEYALQRIHNIPRRCVLPIIRSNILINKTWGKWRLCVKLLTSLLELLRNSVSVVERLQQTPRECLPVLVGRRQGDLKTLSYGKLMNHHPSHATKTGIWYATGSAEFWNV